MVQILIVSSPTLRPSFMSSKLFHFSIVNVLEEDINLIFQSGMKTSDGIPMKE